MKAAQIHRYGGAEIVTVQEVPEPIPKLGQILVKISTASINPFDIKLQKGNYQKNIPLQFPFTIGGDFAGTVIDIGKTEAKYKKGDEVFGQALGIDGGSGSLAEYAVAKIENTAIKPNGLGFREAASMVLTGSSAVQAIIETIKIERGQRILIHGGAGGIGSLAIQIAKDRGAHVITTATGEGLELVKQLGADEVIDYMHQKFDDTLKDLDAVYDTVGGETRDKSLAIIKRGGILVSMLGEPDATLAKKFDVRVVGQQTETSSVHLQKVADLAAQGKIKPIIDKVFSLDEAQKAIEYFENGKVKGKVVVEV